MRRKQIYLDDASERALKRLAAPLADGTIHELRIQTKGLPA